MAKGTNTLDLPEFVESKHWLEWEDVIGQPFRAGDIIAYAATAGRSAKMTIGMVKRINRVDSKGDKITRSRYNYETRISEKEDYCNVTVAPLLDSSNAYSRWTDRDVTIGPEKILKPNISIGDIDGDLYNG
jgi:hypothetical protein